MISISLLTSLNSTIATPITLSNFYLEKGIQKSSISQSGTGQKVEGQNVAAVALLSVFLCIINVR